MRLTAITAVSVLLPLVAAAAELDRDEPVARLAFGSCADQRRPQPIWDAVAAKRPDLFLFLGDNVYADTDDERKLREDYAALDAEPHFAAFRRDVPLVATWDDHDYGLNDGGAEWAFKATSQRVFLDWLRVPGDSPRRTRAGVYDAVTLGPPGRRTQIVLLDTRSFRSPLKKQSDEGRRVYVPNDDPDATVLGDAQWVWLADRLAEPAEVRVLASSIQVLPTEHRFEKWANFPAERDRLIGLLLRCEAEAVVIVSGDRHHAEISRLPAGDGGRALLEVTSSSLNRPVGTIPDEPNRFRVGPIWPGENFGVLTFDWRKPPRVTADVFDASGTRVLEAMRTAE